MAAKPLLQPDTKLHNVTYAKFLPRLMAGVYDWLLVLALMMVLSVPLVAPSNEAIQPGSLWYQLALICLTAGFFAGFWSWSGQTVGMKAWRLKLVTEDGEQPDFARALLRFVCAVIAALPLGAGYLWILADKEGCSWHDRWSGTRVIRLPKQTKSGAG